MAKVLSYMMLIQLNVIMELSNVKKKKKIELSYVTKVRSHVILILLNVIMESSNVRKNKGTTKCNKSIITFDIGTA